MDSIVLAEMRVIYPTVRSLGVNNITLRKAETAVLDTEKVALTHFAKPLKNADVMKLQQWLRQRYQSPSLQLIVK